jgi:RNA polymerase sigma-70 factor (ECF subfamily)
MRLAVRRILERRIDELPAALRTVFVMREVEGMSPAETAECLGMSEATVRRRLVRARARLRDALSRDFRGATKDVFGFSATRYDRIAATVLAEVTRPSGKRGG